MIIIRPVNAVLGWLFRGFNRLFDRMTVVYGRMVGGVLRISVIVLLVYGGLLGLTYWEFITHARPASSRSRTRAICCSTCSCPTRPRSSAPQRSWPGSRPWPARRPASAHTVGVSGQSLLLNANAPNLGSMYVMLEEFDERRGPDLTADAIAARAAGTLPARGARRDRLGLRRTADRRPGHDRRLQADHRGPRQPRPGRTCSGSATRSSSGATGRPGLQGLFNSSRANTPWLYLDIDRTKCMALGVPVSERLQHAAGLPGLVLRQQLQRVRPDLAGQRPGRPAVPRATSRDIRQLQVRNNQGQMIRLATLLDVRNTSGPVMVMRYNMYSATAITGNPAPGTSSGAGDRADAGDRRARSCRGRWPPTGPSWPSCSSRRATRPSCVFALAVVFVFLVLAAQYESWKLPLAVILVVPMCLLCSLVGVNLAGMDVSIFTQIGFVVLVGLASKNAILIVEFAKQRAGGGRRRAARPRWKRAGCGCGRS